MTELASIAELAIGETHTLQLKLHELRRHCLAISGPLLLIVVTAIMARIGIFQLSPILPHVFSLEVALGSLNEERVGFARMPISLSLVMGHIKLQHC